MRKWKKTTIIEEKHGEETYVLELNMHYVFKDIGTLLSQQLAILNSTLESVGK